MPAERLEAARAYAELGYPVFPCIPGGKRPLTLHGCNDATSDTAQIEQWWAENPNANVAISTAGLLVLDLDDGNKWLDDNLNKLQGLNGAPLSLTANGGRHFIFRQPIGRFWRNTAGRLADHVDTRANGGYIVVPPSTLDDTKVYRWSEGQELDVPPASLPQPPDWLIAQLDALTRAPVTAPRASAPTESNKIPSGQRNATLARLAGGMRRMGMTHDEILPAMVRVNIDRCDPPINRREVERIAESIARYPADEVTVALVEHHWEQMHPDADEAIYNHSDPGHIPESLLRVPGFIADVLGYTLATAPYPDRVLAFGGALSLQALLAGRKVSDAADNRTNLYTVTLANSGAGKEYPRKVNQRILLEAGLSDAIGDTFASGEGIEDRVFKSPSMLFQTDEIDGLPTRINQARDSRHEGIVNVLLKFFSSSNSMYHMRVKAGQEPRVVNQPCLCIYGTATPKHFYKALTVKQLTNGFVARTIILETQHRGNGQDATLREVPDVVLATARYWANFQLGRQGNLAHLSPLPLVVQQTPEAVLILREHREVIDHLYRESQERDDLIGMTILARSNEKARKLALVYACSANHQQPIVEAAAAQWACNFVDHQTRRMLFMATSSVAENEFDARCKDVVATLTHWREQHGDEWMPYWRLSRKHPWTEREHEEVRTAL